MFGGSNVLSGIVRFSNSSLNFLINPLTGQAQASPSPQIVFPSILAATLYSRSMSLLVASPVYIRFNSFSIHPFPSLQGVHLPQDSWWKNFEIR